MYTITKGGPFVSKREEAIWNYLKVSIYICWSVLLLSFFSHMVASLTALFPVYFTFLPCRSFTVLQPQAGVLWAGSAPPDQERLFLCRFAMCCVGRLAGVPQRLDFVVKLWKQESICECIWWGGSQRKKKLRE